MSLGARLSGRVRWLLRSSTLRLTLLLSLIFALGMTVAVAVTLTLARDALLERIDLSLDGFAAAVAAGEAPPDAGALLVRPVDEIADLPRPFRRVAARGGGTVDLEQDFRQSDEWRVRIVVRGDGSEVLIAAPIEDSSETLELLGGVLWSTVLAVIIAALALGLTVGLLARRRLRRIIETLDRLAAGELQARTGLMRSSDDLDDLAAQLDVTAAELERLVAQTRHLSASIAHDLRTPLARLRARLERLPESEDRGAALEEAGRLAEIFDTIMRVARIEAAQGTEGFEPIALAPFVAELMETFGPVVEDSGKRLVTDLQSPGAVRGDRQMLVQAMANLLQNAIVHGGDQITLVVEGGAMGVADNGPGVAPEHFAEITKPMVRLDAARSSEGSGLGLALVRAVADRHDARLVLSSEAPSGLRVMMKFAEL